MSLRRALAPCAVVLAVVATPIHAQSGASLKGLLGNASDAALDKLSQPGAFSADSAIRIGLPGGGSRLDGLMKLADRAGVTNDLQARLNDAAEKAASEAKPIFRSAIDRASMSDAVAIAKGGRTGATDYLRRTSGNEITAKLMPLVRGALDRAGVLRQAQQLSALGMDEKKIVAYVTGKTSDGIFTYVGREEERLRANPLESGKELLKGLKF